MKCSLLPCRAISWTCHRDFQATADRNCQRQAQEVHLCNIGQRLSPCRRNRCAAAAQVETTRAAQVETDRTQMPVDYEAIHDEAFSRIKALRQERSDENSVVEKIGGAMLLDGRLKSAEWLSELKPAVEEVTRALGRSPSLCVIHVGDRADSTLYVSRKEEACHEVRSVASSSPRSNLCWGTFIAHKASHWCS
jgi:hypothetical protein